MRKNEELTTRPGKGRAWVDRVQKSRGWYDNVFVVFTHYAGEELDNGKTPANAFRRAAHKFKGEDLLVIRKHLQDKKYYNMLWNLLIEYHRQGGAVRSWVAGNGEKYEQLRWQLIRELGGELV